MRSGLRASFVLLVSTVWTTASWHPVAAHLPDSQKAATTKADSGAELRALVDRLRGRRIPFGPSIDPDDIQKQLIARGEAAVPYLIEGLSHPVEDVREYSAETLGMMGDIARPAVPVLLGRLNAETEFAQFDFVRAIRSLLRPEDDHAVEPLLTLLKSDLKARYPLNVGTVVEAFGILGPRAAAVVPDLLALLAADGGAVGDATLARTLGLIGPAAERALPQLAGMLDARVKGVGSAAAVAIVRIGWEKSGVPVAVLVDAVLEGVEHDANANGQEAAAALAILGALAEPRLTERAGRIGEQGALESVLKVLDDVDARSPRAVDILIDGTRSANRVSVRALAALALGDIPRNARVVEALTRMARADATASVRVAAQRSLNRIHGSPASIFDGILTAANQADIVSSLISLLAVETQKVGEFAVQTLIELGEPGVPQLVLALKTPLPFSVLPRMNPVNRTTSRVRQILLEIGDGAAPYLVEQILESGDEKIVDGAIDVLAELSFEPRTTREKIVYYFVRDAASASAQRPAGRPTFERLREVASEAKPFLLKIAQMTGLANSQRDAWAALSEFGPLSRDLVPALARLHRTGVIDDYFYTMMMRIGGDEAFDQYLAGLRSTSLQGGMELVVLSLSEMVDVGDHRLVAAFTDLARSANRGTRIAAYAALSTDRLFSAAGVDRVLLAGLDDRDDLVRYNIVNHLGSKGRAASFALGKLREIVKAPDLPTGLIGIDGLSFRQVLERAITSIEGRQAQAASVVLDSAHSARISTQSTSQMNV
jgi:HEAT repeat protein